jgi:hypothetical protein
MDIEKEIHSLAAETLAYSLVIQGVLSRLARNPAFKTSIEEGFDQALEIAQSVAVKFGSTASPDHTTKCIRIIEELRAGVLGPDGKPKHLV